MLDEIVDLTHPLWYSNHPLQGNQRVSNWQQTPLKFKFSSIIIRLTYAKEIAICNLMMLRHISYLWLWKLDPIFWSDYHCHHSYSHLLSLQHLVSAFDQRPQREIELNCLACNKYRKKIIPILYININIYNGAFGMEWNIVLPVNTFVGLDKNRVSLVNVR